jgi:hypothetical protein
MLRYFSTEHAWATVGFYLFVASGLTYLLYVAFDSVREASVSADKEGD